MKKFTKSVGFAWEGVLALYRSERNARIHTGIMVVVFALAGWLGISKTEWCLLILMFGMVLSMEAANTGLEKICNMKTREFDPRIKEIKDIGAGAVLLAGLAAIAVGMMILVPRLIETFG
jgi:diacylglycerol kinase